MRNLKIACILLTMIAFVSCKNEKKDADMEMMEENDSITNSTEMENEVKTDEKTISIELQSKSNSNAIGKAVFSEADGITRLEAKFSGLKPGMHAIHIHENADCSAADASSAGGHWNPTFEKHGKWGDAAGFHKGDIGNFEADASGNGSISMQTSDWCISCGDEKKDIIGKGLIVHEGTDDFTSQPSGDAGARVSCGGIIQ